MKKFNKKNQTERPSSPGTPTLIGPNCCFEGVYNGQDSICIQGEFKGRLNCEQDVHINQEAHVQAHIYAKKVTVHGMVTGNIKAEEQLTIGSSGKIQGDLETSYLTVETGGFLNGNCKMLIEQKDQETKPQKVDRFSLFKTVEQKNEDDTEKETTLSSQDFAEKSRLDNLLNIDEPDYEEAGSEEKN